MKTGGKSAAEACAEAVLGGAATHKAAEVHGSADDFFVCQNQFRAGILCVFQAELMKTDGKSAAEACAEAVLGGATKKPSPFAGRRHASRYQPVSDAGCVPFPGYQHIRGPDNGGSYRQSLLTGYPAFGLRLRGYLPDPAHEALHRPAPLCALRKRYSSSSTPFPY